MLVLNCCQGRAPRSLFDPSSIADDVFFHFSLKSPDYARNTRKIAVNDIHSCTARVRLRRKSPAVVLAIERRLKNIKRVCVVKKNLNARE